MPINNPAPEWLAPSPDGNFLLLGRVQESGRQELALADGFGVIQQTLAAFKDGSPGWLTWSSDSTRIAFVHMGSDSQMNVADVYAFNRADGILTQVYRGQNIGGLAFSPDGRMLVLQDDEPTGRHLFTIDLDTLVQRLVQTPNVTLDEWWLAPSWQPAG
jgi:Tol biopolymer transport system component